MYINIIKNINKNKIIIKIYHYLFPNGSSLEFNNNNNNNKYWQKNNILRDLIEYVLNCTSPYANYYG
jgi:hypothetical protein